ncbi:hypothetical protein ACFY9Q_18665 [Streptomyces sp. NPDC012389]|uniref:hypothetical protein n=1 Tax=unclassified Streptomyces TaxID=2593676 RepID=UPI00081E27E5|nr:MULTISPECIES: hypothetical protein [unclassified Streptomyces]MYR97370.1 hypothetical protein [Streptomyces sp. SID4937]MYX15876.1 hypothetical protein [Streptomyces sp. SID8374]SCE24608.1 hypothetical protein GA0115243_109335 [Streptomyces sp. ScaeMP-e83]
MRTSTLRRRMGTGAVAAALLSVAACTGGGGSSSGTAEKPAGDTVETASVAALQQIRKKTGTARSARIEGTTEMGETVSMKQTGTIGWADGLSGSLTLTYTGGTMAKALEQGGGDGSVRARYFKDEFYANMGDAFAATVGGKHWIRYAYKDLAELGGPAGDVLKEQVQNSTPEQGVKALLAAGDLKKAGQEDVRGVLATRYSGTVDVAELTGRNSALDAEQLAALKEQLSAAGVTTQTVDIWVGEDDLLVKKTERGQSAAGAFNSTVFYSDYGTDVSVEKPPAADTADFKEILKQRMAEPS